MRGVPETGKIREAAQGRRTGCQEVQAATGNRPDSGRQKVEPTIRRGGCMKNRPGIVTDEQLQYLDKLRDSGVTNMFGAGDYLQIKFDLDRRESEEVLLYWMDSFGEEDR